MAFVPVPNTCQCELIMNRDGEVIENVIYVENPVAWAIATMTTLASTLHSWWDSDMKPLAPTLLQLTSIKVTDLTTVNSPVIDYVTGLPSIGTAASPGLPNNVVACISFLTGLRGRSFRGRNYLPYLTEADVTGNTILQSTADGYETRYGLMQDAVQGIGYEHVVVSRISNGVERVTGVTTEILSYRCDTRVDSMRRRLPGYGT